MASSSKSDYEVSYPSAGNHIITVSGMSGNVNPNSYSDSGFLVLTGTCTGNAGTVNDSCTVSTASPNTKVYVRVTDMSGAGANFTITP
ncbi:MAG: hypothetical protein OEV94_01285 [Deltaproteobacteria bacterium]|nr:hypothetical protein [Deltaproteobacteria bacterium]